MVYTPVLNALAVGSVAPGDPGVITPVWKNILKGLSHVMIGVLAGPSPPVGVRIDPQYLSVCNLKKVKASLRQRLRSSNRFGQSKGCTNTTMYICSTFLSHLHSQNSQHH